MARKPRRRASLRSTGKAREADLLEAARALYDDPALAMPICEGPCVLFSPVKAASRAIPRIHAARDDEAKLTAFAKRGNELARAYAATLLLLKSGKVPYNAEIKTPMGSAPYAIRGTAKPFFLAGLQNHQDRALRLLALQPWSVKRGIHVFSADRGLVCTGKRPRPPADFVAEEMEDLDLSPAGDGRFDCGHEGDAILLRWKDAGVEARRCEACAGDESTLASLLRHMTGPRLLAGFDVRAALAPLAAASGAPVALDPELPADTRKAYLAASIPDAKLLEGAREARLAALRALPTRVLVAGGKTYGDDVAAFLAALAATPAEARAIEAALTASTRPVVVDKATPARVLAELWPEHGERMLQAAGADAALARELHKPSVGPDEAAELIRRAGREGASRAVLAALPRYQNLPPAAAVADALSRTYRAEGAEAATREALARAASGKQKGVALAFLVELQGVKGQEWRFSQSDRDVAALVGPAVASLLRGAPESYHDALREASLRAGETTPFDSAR